MKTLTDCCHTEAYSHNGRSDEQAQATCAKCGEQCAVFYADHKLLEVSEHTEKVCPDCGYRKKI